MVVAKVEVPRTKALPETESADEEAFPSAVWPETVRLPRVPTLVREEVTTVELRVVPVSVPAGAAFNVASVPWPVIFPAVNPEAVPVNPVPAP